MNRKTIIWIVVGALVAALIAAVGIVSYHVGFNHGNAGITRIGSSQHGMMRSFVIGGGLTRRGAGFPGLGLLAAVLLAGGVGAAIVYLIDPARHSARAVAAGATTGGTIAPGPAGGGFASAPGTGGPLAPQWQQFEQWHRQMHGPGVGGPGVTGPGVGGPGVGGPGVGGPGGAGNQVAANTPPAPAAAAVPEAATATTVPEAATATVPPRSAQTETPSSTPVPTRAPDGETQAPDAPTQA